MFRQRAINRRGIFAFGQQHADYRVDRHRRRAGRDHDAGQHARMLGVDFDDGLFGFDFRQRIADGDRVAFLLEPLVQVAARGIGGNRGELD